MIKGIFLTFFQAQMEFVTGAIFGVAFYARNDQTYIIPILPIVKGVSS